jgi:hypothetical protein
MSGSPARHANAGLKLGKICRTLIAQLLEEGSDPVLIAKWNEIAEGLETALDTPSKSFCFDGPTKELIAKVKVFYIFGLCKPLLLTTPSLRVVPR